MAKILEVGVIPTPEEFKFDFQGSLKTALVQKIGAKFWIHFQGKTFEWSPPPVGGKNRRGSASAAQGAQKLQITAPMPGKITKIFVSEKQNVESGDVVLMMEAMKMEYTLKAHLKASIEKIQVQVGQQVSLGQSLVELKAQDEASAESKSRESHEK